MSQDWKISAKQTFLNDRTPEKLQPIKVEEWGITAYYWKTLTMGERRSISLAFTSATNGDTLGGVVETLMVRLRNEHGQLLFTESEREDILNRYDPDVMNRIVTEMNQKDRKVAPTVEDAEKNS